MRKYFPYILFIFLFFIYFLCYQSVLSHVIYYQEQHHLFLYSKTFFLQHIQSQGWMSYLTAFIIQFFSHTYYRQHFTCRNFSPHIFTD
ncbi:DUF6057 family protein [Bacteroides fragilis]|nr:DUF6057 family protein [Bacteroides fragilis]